MSDGIYTHFGRRPLPEKPAKRAPGRKVWFLWGALVFGLSFVGMALSGLVKRRRRQV